jgi:tyrosine-protein phosphatase SIW14
MLILRSSLVDKDFPADFKAFMKANGIRHCVIEMQGTKKVQIPDAVMNSIMDVVLNKENHPLLIHCNHGKVRRTVIVCMTIADCL